MSIDFKGSHYPKDVILSAVFFMFAMASHIETWRKSWPNEALKLTMPH